MVNVRNLRLVIATYTYSSLNVALVGEKCIYAAQVAQNSRPLIQVKQHRSLRQIKNKYRTKQGKIMSKRLRAHITEIY